MSAVSAPSLSLRDFIQNIFPSIIGICLFAPFFSDSNKITLEGLLVGGAIIGYVASPIIEWFSEITDYLPWLRGRYKKYRKSMKWHSENWDYAGLFYTMDTEDRDYLYLTGSYIRFCKTTGFYFFVYILVNLYWLWHQVALQPQPISVWEVKTPMIGQWQFPTLWLICISFILMYSLLINALSEYGQLFLEKGQYVTMAEKYHRKNGNIAKCIWGKLVRKQEESEPPRSALKNIWNKLFEEQNVNEKPCLNFYKVQLFKNNVKIDEASVDEDGFFRFCDEYKTIEKTPKENVAQIFVLVEKSGNTISLSEATKSKILELAEDKSTNDTIYKLVATHTTHSPVTENISIQENEVPYFEITVI